MNKSRFVGYVLIVALLALGFAALSGRTSSAAPPASITDTPTPTDTDTPTPTDTPDGPTDTPTPDGPTDTPTPTNTPDRPTPTNTPWSNGPTTTPQQAPSLTPTDATGMPDITPVLPLTGHTDPTPLLLLAVVAGVLLMLWAYLLSRPSRQP